MNKDILKITSNNYKHTQFERSLVPYKANPDLLRYIYQYVFADKLINDKGHLMYILFSTQNNLYVKIGLHNKSLNDLIKRYITYIPDLIVLYMVQFLSEDILARVEALTHEKLISDKNTTCVLNDRLNYSEWYKSDTPNPYDYASKMLDVILNIAKDNRYDHIIYKNVSNVQPLQSEKLLSIKEKYVKFLNGRISLPIKKVKTNIFDYKYEELKESVIQILDILYNIPISNVIIKSNLSIENVNYLRELYKVTSKDRYDESTINLMIETSVNYILNVISEYIIYKNVDPEDHIKYVDNNFNEFIENVSKNISYPVFLYYSIMLIGCTYNKIPIGNIIRTMGLNKSAVRIS